MTEHNLRYYALAALTALTVVGWILDKLPPEVTTAVFTGIGAVIAIDVLKNRKSIAK